MKETIKLHKRNDDEVKGYIAGYNDCFTEFCRLLEKQSAKMAIYKMNLYKTAVNAAKGEGNQNGWIPVKTRPLTDEELRFYYDQYGNDNIPEYMLDCPLPEDGQEILITFQMKDGKRCVANDICACDEWGYYLENYNDFGCVIAWMPLPEPYKQESEEEE